LLNGVDVTAFVKKATATTIKIKAKPKLLGLITGANTVQVKTSNGQLSNIFELDL